MQAGVKPAQRAARRRHPRARLAVRVANRADAVIIRRGLTHQSRGRKAAPAAPTNRAGQFPRPTIGSVSVRRRRRRIATRIRCGAGARGLDVGLVVRPAHDKFRGLDHVHQRHQARWADSGARDRVARATRATERRRQRRMIVTLILPSACELMRRSETTESIVRPGAWLQKKYR